MTFEELITGQNGVATSRALVNVIIDQQIGQQIAVSNMAPPYLSNSASCVY
jgi:nuclear pore complex protein Nup155